MYFFGTTGGDIEDIEPAKIQKRSSGSVLPYVGVACLGAILFGYHLGYDQASITGPACTVWNFELDLYRCHGSSITVYFFVQSSIYLFFASNLLFNLVF